MVERELVHVVYAIGEETEQTVRLVCQVILADELFNGDLQAFRQVKRVGEVEGFVFLECLDHVHEFLIISRANDKEETRLAGQQTQKGS